MRSIFHSCLRRALISALALGCFITLRPDGVQAASDVVFAATFIGGVFRSTNGGLTWSPVGFSGVGVETLAVDPVTPSTVYAGVQAEVYKSTDGGTTWVSTSTGLLGTSIVMKIAIDPTDSNVLYVLTGVFGDGVFKSIDAGANWTEMNTGLTTTSNLDGRDLEISPVSPNTIYVTGVTGFGTHNTVDGAANWTPLSPDIFGFELALDPADANTAYVAGFPGVRKTVDGGATWNPAQSGITNTFIESMVHDPLVAGTLYVGTGGTSVAGTVFKTTDGGANWSPMGAGIPASAPGDPTDLSRVQVLEVDPVDNMVLYGGTSRNGVVKTTNGGATWSVMSVGLTNMSIRALAIASPSSIASLLVLDGMVSDLGPPTGPLTGGQATSLRKKIQNIIAKVEDGKITPACNQLGAFMNQVRALARARVLTPAQAADLLAQAEAAAALIPCG